MQPLHGMIDISITLVQITGDLRTFDCEPDTRQRRIRVGKMYSLTESLDFATVCPFS